MKKTVLILLTITIFTVLLLLSSCAMAKDSASGGGGYYSGVAGAPEMDSGASDDGTSSDNGASVRLPAGMMTAGAWDDNAFYNDWLALFLQGDGKNGKFYDYTAGALSWGYNSQKRVSVSVTNGDSPVAGADVTAYDEDGNKLFSAVTDAQGKAYLFPTVNAGTISVTNGKATVFSDFTEEERDISVDKTFTEKKELSKLYLMLNLRDKENFFHMFDTAKKTFSDEGSKCIDRLRFSDDITSIKINGIDYHVPWDSEKVIYDKELPISCYKNKLQKNTESKNSYGHDILTIEIKK